MKFLVLTFVLFCFRAAFTQQRLSVIIQEIMPDPSPSAGLPLYEWIEVKNRSKEVVNLHGWRISDESGESGAMPDYLLAPDSILILCSQSAYPFMSALGPALAITSVPSLDNDGETIVLQSGQGGIIHAVAYDPGWHTNALQEDGGWSLEMIDVLNPCGLDGNWSSSSNAAGGTPGKSNSVSGSVVDDQPPQPLRAYPLSDTAIIVVFNETIDALKASMLTAYSTQGVRFVEAFPIPPLFREVRLTMDKPMTEGEVYSLSVTAICDCLDNEMEEGLVSFGLPDAAYDGLVINEILFNPVASGYDYVELFNNGNKVADAGSLFLGNRDNTGALNDMMQISEEPLLLFPGDYYVITSDENKLRLHYLSTQPWFIHTIRSMPSYPDDKGNVVLTGPQGQVVDEVGYSDKWHFALLAEKEGVSLERIDPGRESADAKNWHSASSASGYGTPAYRNSQQYDPVAAGNEVTIDPAIFSPDNDGLNDQCFIHFRLPAPGYVADVRIYNLDGVLIRRLVKNDLLSTTGYWVWDGLDEQARQNAPGAYIVVCVLFNLEGKSKKFRKVVTLASR